MCGFCNKAKNKGKKKGQSAMEYLMTYGWALLVVMIVLGVLFYLGVFTPKTTSACTFDAGTTYVGSKANTTSVLQLVLGNGPYAVSPGTIRITGNTSTLMVLDETCATALSADIGTNTKYCLRADLAAKSAGNIVTAAVTIPYIDNAGLSHSMTGTCNIRVE